MNHLRRNLLLLLLALFCLPAAARAATSAELHLVQEYDERNQVVISAYVDDNGELQTAEDKGYSWVRYTYWKANLLKTEYLDPQGRPANRLEGGYAVKETTYDGSWRPVSESYYDARGNKCIGPEGYATRTWQYEFKRKIKEIRNYDEKDEPLRSDTLYAAYIVDYRMVHLAHMMTAETYYDADGNLMMNPSVGFARRELDYNRTILIHDTYFDEHGEKTVNPKAGYAEMACEYIGKRLMWQEYYDGEGSLMTGPSGYARIENTYPQGVATYDPLKTMYYDPEGKAILQSGGYYGMGYLPGITAKDKRLVYYGADGERGYCKDGYSRVDCFKNSRGSDMYRQYYDAEDNPMIVPSLGYSRVEFNYVSSKYLMDEKYYDLDHNLVNTKEGYAQVIYEYQNGKLVKKTYEDVDGNPVNCPQGYAVALYTYNIKGAKTGEKFLDAEGNMLMNSGGYAQTSLVVNDDGQTESITYLDAEDQPVLLEGGYCTIRYEWDAQKRATGERYYGLKDEPVLCRDGYHHITWSYGEDGKKSKENYFGLNDEPVECAKGYTEILWEYDAAGNATATLYRRADGTLALTEGQEYAFSRRVYAPDQLSYVTTYYGAAAQDAVEGLLRRPHGAEREKAHHPGGIPGPGGQAGRGRHGLCHRAAGVE